MVDFGIGSQTNMTVFKAGLTDPLIVSADLSFLTLHDFSVVMSGELV